jgi:glycosyltransferase involved in cell wall biosynthesis
MTDKLRSLAEGLPPIVMLGNYVEGGAGIAMLRLHRTLLDCGVRVSVLTLSRDNQNPGIVTVGIKEKSAHIIKTALWVAAMRRCGYLARPDGYDVFDMNRGAVCDISGHEAIKNAGLVHLHWVLGLVGFPSPWLQGKPVVWTLHGMGPFTGGCSCSAGCDRFKNRGCNNCPQLGPFVGSDVALENFAAKQEGYKGLNLSLAAPSRWIGKEAGESILMKNVPLEIIPNSIETDIFMPADRNESRERFKLPLKKKIILFGADGVFQPNKGFYLLAEALKVLRGQIKQELPVLCVFGGDIEADQLPPAYECRFLGRINDKSTLAAIYDAADVFVLPSFQDNLPNVLLEAQSCGIPCVAFHNTGAEDIIEEGVTGFLARHPGLPLANGANPGRYGAFRSFSPESVEDLAAKIKRILDLPPDEYEAMRRACREHALAEYHAHVSAERYLRLYRKILSIL